jgi:DNA-binding phage protein
MKYNNTEGGRMINIEALKECINDSGMTVVAFCDKAGLKKQTFYNRLKNTDNFTVAEVDGMANALRMNARQKKRIFLD